MTQEQYQAALKIIKVYQVQTILVHRDFPHKGKRKACPGDALLESLQKHFSKLLKRY